MKRSIWIVFGLVTLVLAGATAGSSTPRSSEPEACFTPVWSPKGDMLAYTCSLNENYEVYVMRPDGSQKKRVARSPRSDSDPTWSRDGKEIVFASTRTGHGEVYSVRPNGSGLRQLTSSNTNKWHAALSPDGGTLAYCEEDADENYNLVVMDTVTRETRLLLAGVAADEITWSPDGKQLALTAYVYDEEEDEYYTYIEVIAEDGSTRTRLTTTGHDSSPSWSRNGSRIVFRSSRRGISDIYVMAADGSGQRKLFGSRRAWEGHPSLAPNGKRLAYQSDTSDSYQVYVAPLPKGKARQLTGQPKVLTSTGLRCSVIGTARADVLRGTSKGDVICGLGGADRIIAGAGDDVVDGGPGADVIIGGPGGDTLLGWLGNDFLNALDGARDSVDGGAGTDRARLDPSDWVSNVEDMG